MNEVEVREEAYEAGFVHGHDQAAREIASLEAVRDVWKAQDYEPSIATVVDAAIRSLSKG